VSVLSMPGEKQASRFAKSSGTKRTISNAFGYQPDVVKEEITRQKVGELRSMLRRFNDEEGLG
jgi:hypothetical protein